jgi:hypothetical protein
MSTAVSARVGECVRLRVVDWWSENKLANCKGVSKAKLGDRIRLLLGVVKQATINSYAEGIVVGAGHCVGGFYDILQKDADDETLPQEVRDYLRNNLQPRIDEWSPNLNIELTLHKDGQCSTRQIDAELMENTPADRTMYINDAPDEQ